MDEPANALAAFASSTSLTEKWDAARRLMTIKQRAAVAADPALFDGLISLGKWANDGDGVERLIAIDLLVRVPASFKALKPKSRPLIAEAVRAPLPALSIIAEKRGLPINVEPAEVRENVALALEEAEGEWVLPYIVTALAEEDRSKLCRVALAAQLAKRDKSIDNWFGRLAAEVAVRKINSTADLSAAATRLRDLSVALADVISRDRYQLHVSADAGPKFYSLMVATVSLPSRGTPPQRLAEAGEAVVRLLDEILAVRLTLMAEGHLYEPLEALHRWWSPLPYPDRLATALRPIIDKLTAGIVFGARSGQRSEALVRRLKQALNDDRKVKRQLEEIAESEHGLTPDIQDWLRAIERIPSNSTASDSQLHAVGIDRFIREFAPIYLSAAEIAGVGLPSGTGGESDLNKLTNSVLALGSEYGMQIIGRRGDIAEYSPLAYDTPSGKPPSEPKVRIIRQMVVQRRSDGSIDVILKGLATEA